MTDHEPSAEEVLARFDPHFVLSLREVAEQVAPLLQGFTPATWRLAAQGYYDAVDGVYEPGDNPAEMAWLMLFQYDEDKDTIYRYFEHPPSIEDCKEAYDLITANEYFEGAWHTYSPDTHRVRGDVCVRFVGEIDVALDLNTDEARYALDRRVSDPEPAPYPRLK